MTLKSLPAILYNEAWTTQWLFTFYVLTGLVLITLLEYVFLVALMLAVVEESSELHFSRFQSSPVLCTPDISLIRGGRLEDMNDLETRAERFFVRQQRRSRWETIFRQTWTRIAPLCLFIWHRPSTSQDTVTRNIAAILKHLRYHSNSGLYLFRGFMPYLFWYRTLPALLESACSFVLFLAVKILTLLLDDNSSYAYPIADIVLTTIARVTYFAIASELIGFHTFRVLSASTQLTTNVVTENWDPKNYPLQRSSLRRLRRPPAAFILSASLYSLATSSVKIVPSLVLHGHKYVESLPMGPQIYPLLLRTATLKYCITILLETPSFLALVKLQAHAIDAKEPTVIQYPRRKHAKLSSLLFNHTDWIRIIRVSIQSLVLGALIMSAALIFGNWQSRDLEHAKELKDWVLVYILDPGPTIGIVRAARALKFWGTFLGIINPWSLLLPYTIEFDRWLILGDGE